MSHLDRSIGGGVEPLKLRPGLYEFPRVSPDGKHVAVGKTTEGGQYLDLRSVRRELDSPAHVWRQENRFPIWSPDGQRIAFQSDREAICGIFWQLADGTGTAERLTKADKGTSHVPESWSHDGEHASVQRSTEPTDGTFTLQTLSLRDKKAAPFGEVRSGRIYARGRVFTRRPMGRLYVEHRRGCVGVRAAISCHRCPSLIARGLHPLWSPDGKELFYHRLPDSPDHMEVVTVSTHGSFTFGNPVSVPMRECDSVLLAMKGTGHDAGWKTIHWRHRCPAIPNRIVPRAASQCRPQLVRRAETAGTVKVKTQSPILSWTVGLETHEDSTPMAGAIPPRSADTTFDAERVQVGLFRAAPVARRLHRALALSATVIGAARRAIARSQPHASSGEAGSAVRGAALRG